MAALGRSESDAFAYDDAPPRSATNSDVYEPEQMTSPVEQPASENFKVAIRVRPPLPRELDGRFINVVRIPGDHKSITLCEHLDGDDGRGGVYSTQTFTFDHVYDENARQHEVYERSAHPAVASMLQGYNATVMAYGQTGTGKTYTMEGFTSDENRGIIPFATEAVFNFITTCRNKNLKFQVRASYLQIYNEVVSDLLKPASNKQLVIRQSKQRVYVDGLSEWVVRSPSEIYGLIERGVSMRATGSTRMSELSSRSHAIFQIIVEILEGDYEAPMSFKVGKLNIVDLAGSEKVRSTGVTGVRLAETKKINWSLHQLGNVISALTDPSQRGTAHIPYRNSKLTYLLQDSLGGNCKTTLIACMSPALESYQESLSTLKFANRAKNIKNLATVNEDLDQRNLVAKYEREVARLRSIIESRGGDPDVEAQAGQGTLQLEDRTAELGEEKRAKQRLEERVYELESLLVSNGVVDTAGIMSDTDRERLAAQDEDMAQVERYKQLLLKQRDIMLNLTTRLNERDEAILRLHEEIDAYDAHVQMLEDVLEADAPHAANRVDAEAYLARMRSEGPEVRYLTEGTSGALLTPEEKVIELLMLKGVGKAQSPPGSPQDKDALERLVLDRVETMAHGIIRGRALAAEEELAQARHQLAAAEARAHQSELALEMAQTGAQGARAQQQVAQAAEHARGPALQRVQELQAALHEERQERLSLQRDIVALAAEVGERRDPAAARAAERIRDLEATAARRLTDGLFAARHADPTALVPTAGSPVTPGSAGSLRVVQLEATVDTLQRQQQQLRQETQAQLDERAARIRQLERAAQEQQAHGGAEAEKDLQQARRQLATHVKDRVALKKIMESRIKVKVDNISAMSARGEKAKLDAEVASLQNLVSAAITAMNAEQ